MTGTTQSLKSALDSRVRVDQSSRLGSQRQNLGEGLMCPAGSGDIAFDIYGRPSDQNTLRLTDSACSNYTKWPASRRIEVENLERPYLPVCAAGLRGAADYMGKGRDNLPQNLYGEGYQGNFVRHYDTATNMPWSEGPQGPNPPYYQKQIQPFAYSMDSTSHTYKG
ncbi:unnamed protein product [marine sediment metagenome]|uniref:Uncharacterized protein n=1 Tax=marine sediment metagenome TaxID=412755 RepID=X0SL09_9ZZZZ